LKLQLRVKSDMFVASRMWNEGRSGSGSQGNCWQGRDKSLCCVRKCWHSAEVWDFTPSFPVWSSKREAKLDVRLLPVPVCGATQPPEEKSRRTLSATEGRSHQGTLTSQLYQRLPTSGRARSRSPELCVGTVKSGGRAWRLSHIFCSVRLQVWLLWKNVHRQLVPSYRLTKLEFMP